MFRMYKTINEKRYKQGNKSEQNKQTKYRLILTTIVREINTGRLLYC